MRVNWNKMSKLGEIHTSDSSKDAGKETSGGGFWATVKIKLAYPHLVCLQYQAETKFVQTCKDDEIHITDLWRPMMTSALSHVALDIPSPAVGLGGTKPWRPGPVDQRSPTTGPRTGTGPRIILYRAAMNE